jgi:hypothetical protein
MGDAPCSGQTNAGQHCERPAGHYPATHHRIGDARGFMEWTDESMAEFKRIAESPEFPKQGEQERQRYEYLQALIANTRGAILAEIKRQFDEYDGDSITQITAETWLIDGGVDLGLLAMAVVDKVWTASTP